ncbi:hypothetical protein WMZ97_16615 [Lentibacillus sp. N15]|uniref:hypothetical protein n=1 Tax=Lentibacillus songyuanensis TaxID=3136161 RepID=UPI0031BADBAE
MGLAEFFSWAQDQIKYALFLVLFVLLIITAFKRAWIALIGVLIGLSFLAIFIVNPDMLINLGQWFSSKLRLGQS